MPGSASEMARAEGRPACIAFYMRAGPLKGQPSQQKQQKSERDTVKQFFRNSKFHLCNKSRRCQCSAPTLGKSILSYPHIFNLYRESTDPFSNSDTVLLRSSCDVPSSATANLPFARKVANVTSCQILAIYEGRVEALPEPPTAHPGSIIAGSHVKGPNAALFTLDLFDRALGRSAALRPWDFERALSR